MIIPFPDRVEEGVLHKLARLLPVAQRIFSDAPEWGDNPRTGFYLCLADGKTGLPITTKLIGTLPPERIQKRYDFAAEKALRLGKYPDHLSSFESRNVDADEWPGAVRAGQFIVSVSGFPWLVDEVFSCVGGIWLINDRDYQRRIIPRIMQISSNTYFERLTRSENAQDFIGLAA